jgi:molecular chaperone GrpE
MMVKKKLSDQQEAKPEDHKEIADNKDNSTNQEAILPETGAANQSKETTAEEQPAVEKPVTEEKSSEEKLAEMQDKYLRLSAEFDNYRKRTLREKIELSKYANENLLLNIISVMDDFERALSHMTANSDCKAIKDGIDLIYAKFTEFLKQNGVKEIESLNCPFNVDYHYAVSKVKVQEEDKKGKIIDVAEKGYFLQDKVIRHAKVVVGE